MSKHKNDINEELECYKNRGLDNEGKIETLRKKEIKELIGRSPDYTDALMMRMYFELQTSVSIAEVQTQEVKQSNRLNFNQIRQRIR